MMEIASLTAPQRRSFSRLVVRQRRRRLLDDAPRTSRDQPHHAELTLEIGDERSLGPFHASPKSRSNAVPNYSTTSVRGPQIPIDRAYDIDALPTRGFLLWRLSNAGPFPAWRRSTRRWPASETLHMSSSRDRPPERAFYALAAGSRSAPLRRCHGSRRRRVEAAPCVSRARCSCW